MDMASFGLAHQLGFLCGAPIPQSDGSQAVSEAPPPAVSAARKPPPAAGLRSQKPDLVSPPVSPRCSSPPAEDWLRNGRIRASLAAACLVFDEAVGMNGEEVASYAAPLGKGGEKAGRSGVPVFVMLPLDSVTANHNVNRRKAMNASLMALKSAGVEGVMMDVWWGLVEGDEPRRYNWSGYAELLEMAHRHGLKVQAVMSFHQCGGNVGDSCTIPLPRWVVEEIDRDPDLAYTDQWGRRNYEYVSLGCDELPVLKGRTPVQCYADFMRAFRDTFSHLLGDTIVEIQVGMGPAGELRYPSYPELNGTWKFPGIGAFQCYDKYMVSHLKAAAEAIGKSEWGHGGPSDAGHYNNWPEDTPFFRRDGGWNTSYGEFFLSWYSSMLLNHGERILSVAEAVFRGSGAKLSAKVAGIHWHYGSRSHPAELTAGYYNTRLRDGYVPIAKLLARHGVVFNFTCIEMKDYEQPPEAQCSPEGLVRQVVLATREVGVPLAGENALPRFDESAHEQIVRSASLRSFAGDGNAKRAEESRGAMCAFTYLRMSPHLFQPDNWRRFLAFAKKMNESGQCWEQVQREAGPFVHATKPPVREAAAELVLG